MYRVRASVGVNGLYSCISWNHIKYLISHTYSIYIYRIDHFVPMSNSSWDSSVKNTVILDVQTYAQSCFFLYGRSALHGGFDRSWCTETSLVHTSQGRDKRRLSRLSQRWKMEQGSAWLHCQSINSIYRGLTSATAMTSTTVDRIPICCLIKTHNRLNETFSITLCILEMHFTVIYFIFEPCSHASWLSMSIDFIDPPCRISPVSSHMPARFHGGTCCMFPGIWWCMKLWMQD